MNGETTSTSIHRRCIGHYLLIWIYHALTPRYHTDHLPQQILNISLFRWTNGASRASANYRWQIPALLEVECCIWRRIQQPEKLPQTQKGEETEVPKQNASQRRQDWFKFSARPGECLLNGTACTCFEENSEFMTDRATTVSDSYSEARAPSGRTDSSA
jgi:hypothetical protein